MVDGKGVRTGGVVFTGVCWIEPLNQDTLTLLRQENHT
jgi:hypothetical protein